MWFSSSHYCGGTNEAACILVDDEKIRTIRLDTGHKMKEIEKRAEKMNVAMKELMEEDTVKSSNGNN